MMKTRCGPNLLFDTVMCIESSSIEASRRMVQKYDFVITSGGIGPTHDDITYASLAKAFEQPLKHHPETLRRMTEFSKHRKDVLNQSVDQKAARERMALFPAQAEVLFVGDDIWVPVCRLEGKLCIFPGVPGSVKSKGRFFSDAHFLVDFSSVCSTA